MKLTIKTCKKAKRLLDAYRELHKEMLEYTEQEDAVFDKLLASGIDIYAEENEGICNKATYEAGLTDEYGETDIYDRLNEARRALVEYSMDNIIPCLPLRKEDLVLLKGAMGNAVYMGRLTDLLGRFLDRVDKEGTL